MSILKLKSGTFFFVVFALALLLPTSVNGAFSQTLTAFWHLGCAALLGFAIFRLNPPPVIKTNFFIGFLLIGFLLIFTMLSPLNGYALGAVIPYLGIVCLLSTDFRRWRVGPTAIRIFALAAACLLILGWGTVLGYEGIIDFQSAHYQQFNDEIFEQMVGWYAKPVTVYATHSLSAFAYFALSVTFFRMAHFERRFRIRALWLSYGLGFALLIPYLMSNSAIALTLLLIGAGLFYLFKARRWIVLAALILAALSVAVVYADAIIGIANSLFRLQDILSSHDNGFAGRYSSGSRLEPTYTYLIENAGWPIGLSFDPRIAFGDNFIGEYVLRLTPVGYLGVLFMLYKFLRTNLPGKLLPRLFFAFFLIGDVSFPLLTSLRFMFMIPAVVLIWRNTAPAPLGRRNTASERERLIAAA